MVKIFYICPVVHLRALDMLSVDGPLRESVTSVDHLIVPPSCGLRFYSYDVRLGFDQQVGYYRNNGRRMLRIVILMHRVLFINILVTIILRYMYLLELERDLICFSSTLHEISDSFVHSQGRQVNI